MQPSRKSLLDTVAREHAAHRAMTLACARSSRGFTLVEMMVGLLVSLIGTLAMMSAFSVFEEQKRTTASGDDAQQNGSYALFEMERQIRTAGSGMEQGNRYGVWGCTLNAYTGGTQVLPASSLPAAPYPFATSGWPLSTLAVPVLIASGGTGPDVIGVIGGNAAMHTFKSSIGSGSGVTVPLDLTIGMFPKDYVLNSKATGGACSLGFATTVTTTTTGSGNNIVLDTTASPTAGFATGYVFDFGPSPAFSLYGVAANSATNASSLMMYDLLQRGASGAAPAPIADGILTIKALYGIDSTASCPTVNSMVDPGLGTTSLQWLPPTGNYAIAKLTASNIAACTAMAQIKAIRLAVVSQSLVPERNPVNTATSLQLFADTGAPQTVNIQSNYRYKVYDTTIPIRNAFIGKLY